MKKTLFMLVTAIFLIIPTAAFAAEPELTLEEIVDRIDKLYRSETSYAEVEMKIVNPNWERTMRMELWSEGMDKTFISILSPKKDKGIATLRIDREMWNFFPKINKVMKIPPSLMMGAWMGSDFTNDDLVKESTLMDDYNSKIVTGEGADPELYVIEMTPKENTATVWGKIVITARKKDYIPLEQVYYDEKGNKMRVMTFKDIKDFNGRILPAVLEMVPLSKKKEGHKTLIRYIEADFDLKLPKDTFTLRNLQKKR